MHWGMLEAVLNNKLLLFMLTMSHNTVCKQELNLLSMLRSGKCFGLGRIEYFSELIF